jgi:hypothetical protein
MNTPFLYEGTSYGFLKVNLLNFSNILSVIVPILLSVAFMTIIERKILAAMQRRLGPTDVGLDNIINKDYCKLSIPSITPACVLFKYVKRPGRGVSTVAQVKRNFHSITILDNSRSRIQPCASNLATYIINILYKDRITSIDSPILSIDYTTGSIMQGKRFD